MVALPLLAVMFSAPLSKMCMFLPLQPMVLLSPILLLKLCSLPLSLIPTRRPVVVCVIVTDRCWYRL